MTSALFDAHCDTISRLAKMNSGLRKNTCHLDLEKISNLKMNYGQVFAAFVDKKNICVSPFQHVKSLIDKYFDEIKKNEDLIEHCEKISEIQQALKNKKVAALLSVEGGEAIVGEIGKLETLYSMGVRIMTLTWNYKNEICDGIGVQNGHGLTQFGREVVLKMNEMGMLIDISHISRSGFQDVLELSQKPVAATHSNAFGIKNNVRNLNDEEIKQLIQKGGFIGINLYSEFLSDRDTKIKDVLKHIEHILELGGEDVVGFGSDFDGIDSLPYGMESVQDFSKIIDEFKKIGYSDLLINKITSANFLNIIRKTIG